jgi:hypothetical protein
MALKRCQHASSMWRFRRNQPAHARRTDRGKTRSFQRSSSSSTSMKNRMSSAVPSRNTCSYTRDRSRRLSRSYFFRGPLQRTCNGSWTSPEALVVEDSSTSSGSSTGRALGPRSDVRESVTEPILRRRDRPVGDWDIAKPNRSTHQEDPSPGALVVDRSTTRVNPVDSVETGRTEPHFGGLARPRRAKTTTFAKVRVAGSNPVFRSREGGF